VADAASSIRPDGTSDISFAEVALRVHREVMEELRQGKPAQILDGTEIMNLILEIRPDFNVKMDGRLIGEIKGKVNDLYDLKQIETKDEAENWIRQNY
jgi:hypothetical protein